MKRTWSFVIAFDLLALLALLAIGTYGTLTHDHGFYDRGGSPERTLIDLWTLWGLIPGVLVTAAASFGSINA